MSDWISELREACREVGQPKMAQRIGYSTTVISQVLNGKYPGDLNRVQTAVEGALMGADVECPILGQIPRQRCVEHQRRRLSAANEMSVRLYRACRAGCENSLIKGNA